MAEPGGAAIPQWRILELIDGERRPYKVGLNEWRAQRSAKAIADTLSVQGHLYIAEQVPDSR
jgi:hypothetical protein